MQTYLVHMREPRRLWRELGARRFISFQVLMGGLILSALVHPWFYVFLVFDLLHGQLLSVPESMLGRSLLWIGVFNLIAGYLSAIWLGTAACARRGRLRLSAHAVLMPLYWFAISITAYLALRELASAPFYRQKTGIPGGRPVLCQAASRHRRPPCNGEPCGVEYDSWAAIGLRREVRGTARLARSAGNCNAIDWRSAPQN